MKCVMRVPLQLIDFEPNPPITGVLLIFKDRRMQAEELLKIVQNELEERKGQFIKVLDVIGKTSITDYMVIVTATSERHAKALCDYVLERIKNQGVNPLGVEGGNTEWVLVDLGDVILHIMTAQSREFYQLEKLWSLDQSAIEEKAS